MLGIDMAGKVIGPWTFLHVSSAPAHASHTPGTFWSVRCTCGEIEVHSGAKLRAGRYGRGCLKCGGKNHSKRGICSPTYNSWRAMRSRCLRPDDSHYSNYGGRGIGICDAWKNDFAQFLNDMGERPPRMSLDRIDNNGNYEPENCRWADPKTQNRNNDHFRLTDDQVEAIRNLIALGARQIDIATLAGVCRSQISNIATGRARPLTAADCSTPYAESAE